MEKNVPLTLTGNPTDWAIATLDWYVRQKANHSCDMECNVHWYFIFQSLPTGGQTLQSKRTAHKECEALHTDARLVKLLSPEAVEAFYAVLQGKLIESVSSSR